MDKDVICLNISVVLQKGKVLKAVKLIPGKVIVFEKLRFEPDNAVGLPYGSVFEVKAGTLLPVASVITNEVNEASGKDNRCLIDTHGKSQVLKRDDLISMKMGGASGPEIIQKLVENSSSFSDKTVFSQKKYLKKKQRKYLSYIQIHKPTARLICKLYEEREPAKICHMRGDVMSQLLTTTNICCGSNVVVAESCSGVVLGMIMERMGESGSLVNLHVGETPANLFAMSHFNFSSSQWELLHSLPLHKLAPLLAGKSFLSTFPDGASFNAAIELQDANNEPDQTENESRKRKHPLSDEEKLAIRLSRQRKRFKHQQMAWKLLETKQMDALIVATKYHPTPIVTLLMETLAPSKPFAVFSEYKESLMELFVHLSSTSKSINLQLNDIFCRQYQVLEERTHPHVMMSTNGGYLLTGIKV